MNTKIQNTESQSNVNAKIMSMPGTGFDIEPLESDNLPNSLFLSKPANVWLQEAATRPAPKQLYGSLWFEGEVCILFADTNVGKSILGVQIGDCISRGFYSAPFEGMVREKILYLDFELSDKQFEARYSENFTNHYQFDNGFIRLEIDPDMILPDDVDFETYLLQSLEREIKATGSKIVVIDNLTWLKNETEKGGKAAPLMQELKRLKSKYGLSILVLAHTPKRDFSKPLSRNDLQGSRLLLAFADSCFAIGESQKDKSLRYIKQIKVRNTEHIYDSENVIVCNIEKRTNCLRFEFAGYSSEREHLKEESDKDRKNIDEKIIEAFEENPDLSYQQIADTVGTYKVKVKRVLDKHKNNVTTS